MINWATDYNCWKDWPWWLICAQLHRAMDTIIRCCFCRVTLSRRAVSVRPSVTFGQAIVSKRRTSTIILELLNFWTFSPSGSPSIFVFFSEETLCKYSDGNSLTGRRTQVWYEKNPIFDHLSRRWYNTGPKLLTNAHRNCMWSIEWCHFLWLWVIPKPLCQGLDIT